MQVWQYEGDYTLWDLMQKKEFPYNMEPLLLGGELDLPKGPRRKAVTIQLVLQQVGPAGLGTWDALQSAACSSATGLSPSSRCCSRRAG